MILRLWFSVGVAALVLFGCPKNISSRSLSDEERMDRYAALMEELKTKSIVESLACTDWCKLKEKLAEISQGSCEIASRNPDREDIQRRCISYKEELVQFQEQCTRCQ